MNFEDCIYIFKEISRIIILGYIDFLKNIIINTNVAGIKSEQ